MDVKPPGFLIPRQPSKNRYQGDSAQVSKSSAILLFFGPFPDSKTYNI
jgi:hypothetical protein